MAKVKSMPPRNTLNFVVNDALTNLVSLEVCDESPLKYNIDIDVLLNTDNTNSYHQCVDKDDANESGNDNVVSDDPISGNLQSLISNDNTCVLELLKEGDIHNKGHINLNHNKIEDNFKKFDFKNSVFMEPITSNCDSVVNDHISLSALAQNHLSLNEKSQKLKDSCVDLDFALEDLLTNIDGSSMTIKNSKPSNSDRDLNSFILSTSPINDKLEMELQEKVINDDLSTLLDSSETVQQSTSFSLADLANCHFLNNLPSNANEFLKENSLDGNKYSCENDDDSQFILLNSLENISLEKSEIKASVVEESLPLKSTYSVDAVANCDEYDKTSHTSNISDNEIVDLNFCIKKPKSVPNGFTFGSASSTDSGFHEADFVSSKCILSFQDFVSSQSLIPYSKEFKSPLVNSKQSLLSKAISCKSKLSKAKCEKLKNIRKELYNKQFSAELFDCVVPNVTRFDRIVDQSNQCVISSMVADQ